VELAFSFLGAFLVKLDGKSLHFATNSARALLAYLTVEALPDDRTFPRSMLASLLWTEQPEATARHNLRQALLHLRQGLGESASSFLQITPQTIGIKADLVGVSDLYTFRQLLGTCSGHSYSVHIQCPGCLQRMEEAVALYQGEFLRGLSTKGGHAFENWVHLRREQAHRQVMQTLRMLTEYHAMTGAYDRMQHHAEHQLALEPWDEAAHRQLMVALAARGERAAALAQYKRCYHILARELDALPSQETEKLYNLIRLDKLLPLQPGNMRGAEQHMTGGG
jgi:DNA-binding SARP family transcriptional activator